MSINLKNIKKNFDEIAAFCHENPKQVTRLLSLLLKNRFDDANYDKVDFTFMSLAKCCRLKTRRLLVPR